MLSQLPFMTRGLLVALLGLCGTFLVLVLVYLGVKPVSYTHLDVYKRQRRP